MCRGVVCMHVCIYMELEWCRCSLYLLSYKTEEGTEMGLRCPGFCSKCFTWWAISLASEDIISQVCYVFWPYSPSSLSFSFLPLITPIHSLINLNSIVMPYMCSLIHLQKCSVKTKKTWYLPFWVWFNLA